MDELNESTKTGIRWLVDRRHVGESVTKVGRYILERARRGRKDVPPHEWSLTAQAIVYARNHHRANRDLYRRVMRGGY